MLTDLQHSELIRLLETRIQVISDHAFRDRAPSEHLAKLKEVSEALSALHGEVKGQIDRQLDHYLTHCSYDKALAHLRESTV